MNLIIKTSVLFCVLLQLTLYGQIHQLRNSLRELQTVLQQILTQLPGKPAQTTLEDLQKNLPISFAEYTAIKRQIKKLPRDTIAEQEKAEELRSKAAQLVIEKFHKHMQWPDNIKSLAPEQLTALINTFIEFFNVVEPDKEKAILTSIGKYLLLFDAAVTLDWIGSDSEKRAFDDFIKLEALLNTMQAPPTEQANQLLLINISSAIKAIKDDWQYKRNIASYIAAPAQPVTAIADIPEDLSLSISFRPLPPTPSTSMIFDRPLPAIPLLTEQDQQHIEAGKLYIQEIDAGKDRKNNQIQYLIGLRFNDASDSWSLFYRGPAFINEAALKPENFKLVKSTSPDLDEEEPTLLPPFEKNQQGYIINIDPQNIIENTLVQEYTLDRYFNSIEDATKSPATKQLESIFGNQARLFAAGTKNAKNTMQKFLATKSYNTIKDIKLLGTISSAIKAIGKRSDFASLPKIEQEKFKEAEALFDKHFKEQQKVNATMTQFQQWFIQLWPAMTGHNYVSRQERLTRKQRQEYAKQQDEALKEGYREMKEKIRKLEQSLTESQLLRPEEEWEED